MQNLSTQHKIIRNTQKPEQALMVAGACLGWFAIILQFYLILANRTESVSETIARFFGFFTILTNILVALCFTFLLLRPATKTAVFFGRPATLTAITVYIAVVGIVYNAILRFLWSPKGLQFIVDELLHTVIPLLFCLYWIMFVPKDTLKWKNIWPWMIYPLVYCIYTLFRGAAVKFYPYPFIDVGVLGYNMVFRNIAGLIIVFLVISLLLVATGKYMSKRNKS